MKEIMNEWRQFLLTEVQTLKLIYLVTSAKENGYSQNDIQLLTQFWNNNSKIRSKYSKVIEKEISDPNKNEPIEHMLSAVINHYEQVYDKLSSIEKMKLASAEDIDIGKLRVQADLAEQEVEDNIDPMEFKNIEIREQCKYENGRPIVGKYKDFDVAYSGADWVVIEPKTIKGSIAWSHGKPDGSEETDSEYRVTWCTGTKNANWFFSYAIDYHMFYCISVNYEEIKYKKSEERRLCLSFDSEGELKLGPETVNGENDEISKDKAFSILKNDKLFNGMIGISKERKKTHTLKLIENSTYEEFVNMAGDNEEIRESNNEIYLTHCSVDNLREIIGSERFDNVENKDIIAQREDLLEVDPSGDLIRTLSNDDDSTVISFIAANSVLLKLEDGEDLIRSLANDDNEYIRASIARRKDLLKLKDGKKLIEKLANDNSKIVRVCLLLNDDLLEVDPSGDLKKSLISSVTT